MTAPESVRDVIARAIADHWTASGAEASTAVVAAAIEEADAVLAALDAAGKTITNTPGPSVRVLSGQVGRGLNYGDAPGRYEQWILRIDCDLNGCDPHHSDEGDAVSVDDDRWVDADGIGRVNGHKARLERRSVMVGPWKLASRG